MINIKDSFSIFCSELKYFEIEVSPEIFRSLKYDNIRNYKIIEKLIYDILTKILKINIEGDLIMSIIKTFHFNKDFGDMKKSEFYFIILGYILFKCSVFEKIEQKIFEKNTENFIKNEEKENELFLNEIEERKNILKEIKYYIKKISLLEKNKEKKLKIISKLLNHDDFFLKEYLDFSGEIKTSLEKNLIKLNLISKIHQNPDYKKYILLWFLDTLNKKFFCENLKINQNISNLYKNNFSYFANFYIKSQKIIKNYMKFFLKNNKEIDLSEEIIKQSPFFGLVNKIEKNEDIYNKDIFLFKKRILNICEILREILKDDLKNQMICHLNNQGYNKVTFFTY